MAIKFIESAFRSDASPSARLTLIVLAYHAKDIGRCFPSIQRIASMSGLSRSTVIRSLKELEDSGYLNVLNRTGRGNRYELVYIPPQQKDVEDDDYKWSQGDTGSDSECHPEGVNLTFNESQHDTLNVYETNTKRNLKSVGSAEGKSKSKPVTINEFKNSLAEGERISTQAMRDFCKTVGIPAECMQLAWQHLLNRYGSESPKQKKYIDWRAVLFNAIRENYSKAWAFNQQGEVYITTVGEQLRRQIMAEVEQAN